MHHGSKMSRAYLDRSREAGPNNVGEKKGPMAFRGRMKAVTEPRHMNLEINSQSQKIVQLEVGAGCFLDGEMGVGE